MERVITHNAFDSLDLADQLQEDINEIPSSNRKRKSTRNMALLASGAVNLGFQGAQKQLGCPRQPRQPCLQQHLQGSGRWV